MRFTIRHLLWFTLLAAVGCWWWLPSANDAKIVECISLGDPDQTQRFTSQAALDDSCQPFLQPPDISNSGDTDFAVRDLVAVKCSDVTNLLDSQVMVESRLRGALVLVGPFKAPFAPLSLLVSVEKYARVFEVTQTQLYLIDGGVAAGLLTLAFGSLFIGRKRRAVQPTSAQPTSH